MICLHSGILFSHEEEGVLTRAIAWVNLEGTTLTERSQIQKPHFVRFQIYEMFRTGTSVEAESKLVASRAWEDEGIGRYTRFL